MRWPFAVVVAGCVAILAALGVCAMFFSSPSESKTGALPAPRSVAAKQTLSGAVGGTASATVMTSGWVRVPSDFGIVLRASPKQPVDTIGMCAEMSTSLLAAAPLPPHISFSQYDAITDAAG